jgi:hypothetical protein
MSMLGSRQNRVVLRATSTQTQPPHFSLFTPNTSSGHDFSRLSSDATSVRNEVPSLSLFGEKERIKDLSRRLQHSTSRREPALQHHPYRRVDSPLTLDSKDDHVGDVRPRITEEQHMILEQHFQVQHKPSTPIKKEFASKLGLPLDTINVSEVLFRLSVACDMLR